MVLKWRREGGAGWMTHAAVNAFGAVLTDDRAVVVAVTKFAEGAWIIVALVPLLVWHFRSIHATTPRWRTQLSLRG